MSFQKHLKLERTSHKVKKKKKEAIELFFNSSKFGDPFFLPLATKPFSCVPQMNNKTSLLFFHGL
jgi:hypothetical protein